VIAALVIVIGARRAAFPPFRPDGNAPR